MGEWHLNKLNGCTFVEAEYGYKCWGDRKDHKIEGYATLFDYNKEAYIGQWLDGKKHGYGIIREKDGAQH